ncbi:reprolysin-like metallopeptidase [uncultured Polaribacter sp.]|uniref:reprolysin-like metallopeptidase n=1 Tax=uncultured Polaribacter sp. TaxID=174711 RepID=UPI002618A1FB|nr:zinc-dependent metalloprotease family protein [uncultured Polaribacter sp.]
MKKKTLLLFLLISTISNAQNYWKKLASDAQQNKTELYLRKNLPVKQQLFSLNLKSFTTQLHSSSKEESAIIFLPNATGKVSKFKVIETSNFEDGLTKKFPNIKSYTAQGIEDLTAIAKISIGTDGIHLLITSGKQNTLYIDPFTKNNKTYIAYKKTDLISSDTNFQCHIDDLKKEKRPSKKSVLKNTSTENLKIFRLALACSGEYAQFHLNRQGVLETATEKEKKAAVLSAMNTSITRVNSVFEKDLGIKMILVDNNDAIIFLDKETDGITEGDPDKMINESQTISNNFIGNDNYDLGHLFSLSGDGIAGLGVVCLTGLKGRGVTGRAEPIGDPYNIDYVAHEIGHQFGATHTQNNKCNRTRETAVEPGSGSTIMGYAGICAPNVQGNSDGHFHSVNITQIQSTLRNTATCGIRINTNNNRPTANAGFDVSIPKGTPFVLKGTATDADGMESLTYNWEQIDHKIATMPPVSTNENGPLFRSLPSKVSSERYFPEFQTVIAGTIGSVWEVVPTVARELNIAFTVRDNYINGGATASDKIKITVTEAAPFVVTAPKTAVLWDTGSQQSITWEVSTTNQAPINCKNVRIKLSTDGGVTFPFILAESTPNDGMHTVTIPNLPTTNARILIEAIDHIFYNVNTTNFAINATAPTFILSNGADLEAVCSSTEDSVSFTLNADFINGFEEMVTFSAADLPEGTTASFLPAQINKSGRVILTIKGLNELYAQKYKATILGASASVTQNSTVDFAVFDDTFTNLTLTKPSNASVDINTAPTLLWSTDSNATLYQLEVASDPGFASFVLQTNPTTNSYTFKTALTINTDYYWRVKSKNDCGEGMYSNISSFRTLIPQYCTSTFTHDAGGSEHITNVTFNTINNSSENDKIDGYEDFTTISTTVKQGDIYQLQISLDTGGFQDRCFVFIDWNQDLVFDMYTERYDLGVKTEDLATAIYDISIPEDAVLGNTRMRVVIEYDDPENGAGEGACDTMHKTEWGETEDYTIQVKENRATASFETVAFEKFKLYPNPSNGKIQLTFKKQNQNPISIKLFTIHGQLIATKNYAHASIIFNQELNFKNIPTGFYFLRIQNGEIQAIKKLLFQ